MHFVIGNIPYTPHTADCFICL